MIRKYISIIIISTLVMSGCMDGVNSIKEEKKQAVVEKEQVDVKNGNKIVEKKKPEMKVSGEKLVEPQLLIEDLEFMYKMYKEKNLSSVEDEEILNAFEKKYEELVQSISEPMGLEEFYFEVSKLAAVTKNAHATVKYAGRGGSLPYSFKWLEEGLVVTDVKGNGPLEVGDKVLEIGGKSIEECLEELSKVISSENEYWKRNVAAKKIPQRMVLEYLGAVEEDGIVDFKVQEYHGDIAVKQCEFEEIRGVDSKVRKEQEERAKRNTEGKQQSQKKTSKVSYEILEEYDTGILKAESCYFDEKAKRMVGDFFALIMEKNMGTVVLDLRGNPGGPTQLIDEFLKFLDVDKAEYWRNTEVDFGVKDIQHYSDELFKGELYIAVDNGTFSAGHMFAATLRYNDLGKVIGEPTGQADIFYGRAGNSVMPNTGISIGTTTVTVYMQNEEYPDALMPDIHIPLRIEDIVDGKDPIKEWIKQ